MSIDTIFATIWTWPKPTILLPLYRIQKVFAYLKVHKQRIEVISIKYDLNNTQKSNIKKKPWISHKKWKWIKSSKTMQHNANKSNKSYNICWFVLIILIFLRLHHFLQCLLIPLLHRIWQHKSKTKK